LHSLLHTLIIEDMAMVYRLTLFLSILFSVSTVGYAYTRERELSCGYTA
jgi:hypothetical protein